MYIRGTCIHTYIRTLMLADIHTFKRTYLSTYTYVRTDMYKYSHTYNTYMHARFPILST